LKKQICIAQINYFRGNTRYHIDRIKNIISENRSSDIIIFPELILHGHPSVERPEGFLYRKIKKFYRSIASESDDIYKFVKSIDASVIIGELQGQEGNFYNVATYIDRDITESYKKTHVHWTENFIPGNTLKVFRTPLGLVGITICFDGAFGEIWRVLALRGAEIIVNIAAVPKTFPVEYMWRRLSGAAINNQVFILYANRPGDYFAGHSAIFNPRGDILISAGHEETIIHAEIDLDDVKEWRNEENLYQNRRPLLYREITRREPLRARGSSFFKASAKKNGTADVLS
jgi:predicted amidohydrolase